GSIGGGEAAKLDEAESGCDLCHGWRVAGRRRQYPACLEQAQRAQVAIGRGAMHGAEGPQERARADAGGMTDFCDADRLFRMPACPAQGPVDNSLILPWWPCLGGHPSRSA